MTIDERLPRKMNWIGLIFLVLGAGIIIIGYVLHRNFEQNYRVETKQRLDVIAKLKVDELTRWRHERMADGRVLLENPVFGDLARRVFAQPADATVQRQILDWLGSILAYDDYDQIRLMDTQGVTRLSLPDGLAPASSNTLRVAAEVVLLPRRAIEKAPQRPWPNREHEGTACYA